MSNEMTEALQITSIDDAMKLGEVFAASGFFDDAKEASQAVVKILAGAEMGISPIAAMRGVYVIHGKTSLSASLMATQVRRHPRYDYDVVGVNNQGAKIAFLRDGEVIGEATFTASDARQAGHNISGNGVWGKYTQDMYFARAMSRGCRRYCPEVFSGAVYTQEEAQEGERPSMPAGGARGDDTPEAIESEGAKALPKATGTDALNAALDGAQDAPEPEEAPAGVEGASAGESGDAQDASTEDVPPMTGEQKAELWQATKAAGMNEGDLQALVAEHGHEGSLSDTPQSLFASIMDDVEARKEAEETEGGPAASAAPENGSLF